MTKILNLIMTYGITININFLTNLSLFSSIKDLFQ